MIKRRKIYRVLAVAAWCLVGIGVCILLGAAVKDRSTDSCTGYEIDINGSANGIWFIDKKDIVTILSSNGAEKIKGRRLGSFDLNALEAKIERNVWIADAQLFFDNTGVMQVRVKEREPVARVFSENGTSFYIDTAAKVLPLSDKMVARLPVFTGFPATGTRIQKKDMALARDVIALSGFITRHPFWMAQVAQLDIRNRKEFDLLPVVGNHVIELGEAAGYEKKFNRLLNFYTQVLSKTGMDKYTVIRLQFRDQVVAVKKEGYVSKSDSLKVISNIQSLIASARKLQEMQLQNDSMALAAPRQAADTATGHFEKPLIKPQASTPGNSSVHNPIRKTASYENQRRVPKAVMKKE